MINFKEFIGNLPTTIFYLAINTAFYMGIGFAFISASVKAEQFAEFTGIDFFSLNGHLSLETATEFSILFHGVLHDYNLIPILFSFGMLAIFIQRYRKLKDVIPKKKRFEKAISLAVFESLFLSAGLFAGSIANIHAISPEAITNIALLLAVTISGFILGIFRAQLADNMEKFIESHKLNND